MEHLIFAANAILYILLFVLILWKVKKSGKYIALIITGVFIIAGLSSIMYFESDVYTLLSERWAQNSISIAALLFIFVNLLIYLYPVNTIEFRPKITYPRFGQYDIISIVAVMIGVLSIIPFAESMIKISSMSVLDFADAYSTKFEYDVDVRGHFSVVGRLCNGLISWLRFVVPILFFYVIAKKKSLVTIMLVGFAMLTPILTELLIGGRGALYNLLTILVLNFFLFRSVFSKKVIKLAMLFSGIIGGTMVALLVMLTIGRAEGEAHLATEEIFRYLGEGFVNFSETGWFVNTHTGGYSIFNGTGQTFMSNISEIFDKRDYQALTNFMNIRMYVYYTVFGDYFLDFGVIKGTLFNCALAFGFYLLIRKNPSSFSSLILINLYAKIGLQGFSCFCYMTFAEFVLFTLLIYVLCRMFEPRLIKKKIFEKRALEKP